MPPNLPTSPPSGAPSDRRNQIVFGLLCVIVVAGVTMFALYSRDQRRQREASAAPPISESGRQLAEVCQHPYLMFRNTALGPSYGRLSVAPLSAPDGTRYPTVLDCERVYSTGQAGLCLQAIRNAFPTFKAVSFDRQFQVLRTFDLNGGPSRVRISQDGHWGAVTVFIAGHGYTSINFSTQTTLYDLQSLKLIGDLEQFTVIKNGQPFKATDFNFWGVTFEPEGDGFYATLASGGVCYLVEGRVSSREVRVLRQGVECPSLSPDGRRLVFKSRIHQKGQVHWQLHVLDLRTQQETIINESHSVDDQAEWLDPDHVLYGLPRNMAGSGTWDIWVARADGAGAPVVFVHDALSPCVVRS